MDKQEKHIRDCISNSRALWQRAIKGYTLTAPFQTPIDLKIKEQETLPRKGAEDTTTQSDKKEKLAENFEEALDWFLQSKMKLLFIKGDAGYGKSTMLWWLTGILADDILKQSNKYNYIPIHINLSDSTKLVDSLGGIITPITDSPSFDRPRLFLIDGLDALPSGFPDIVIKDLLKVTEEDDCRIIITTRPNVILGAAESLLSSKGYVDGSLQDLRPNDKERFLTELNIVDGFEDFERKLLRHQISNIPLFFALSVRMFLDYAKDNKQNEKIPENLQPRYPGNAGLMDLFVNHLINRAQPERISADENIESLLLKLQRYCLTEINYRLEQNIGIDNKLCIEMYQSEDDLEEVEMCLKKAMKIGLITRKVRSGVYEMLHQQFLEYFAGCALANELCLIYKDNNNLEESKIEIQKKLWHYFKFPAFDYVVVFSIQLAEPRMPKLEPKLALILIGWITKLDSHIAEQFMTDIGTKSIKDMLFKMAEKEKNVDAINTISRIGSKDCIDFLQALATQTDSELIRDKIADELILLDPNKADAVLVNALQGNVDESTDYRQIARIINVIYSKYQINRFTYTEYQTCKIKEILQNEKITAFLKHPNSKEMMNCLLNVTKDDILRVQILGLLAKLGSTEAADLLIDMLSSENEVSINIDIQRALEVIHSDRLIKPLMSFFNTTDFTSYYHVVGIIAENPSAKARNALVEIIKNNEIHYGERLSASRALLEIDKHYATELLWDILGDDSTIDDHHVKTGILWHLGELKDERAIDLLIDIVTDKTTPFYTRDYAIKALTSIHPEKAIPVFLELLDDDIESIRAIHALNYLKRKDVEEALVRKLCPGDPLYYDAAEALADIGSEKAVDPLIEILNDKENYNAPRKIAADKLGKLGSKNAIPSLQDVFINDDEDHELRCQAAKTLLQLDASIIIDRAIFQIAARHGLSYDLKDALLLTENKQRLKTSLVSFKDYVPFSKDTDLWSYYLNERLLAPEDMDIVEPRLRDEIIKNPAITKKNQDIHQESKTTFDFNSIFVEATSLIKEKGEIILEKLESEMTTLPAEAFERVRALCIISLIRLMLEGSGSEEPILSNVIEDSSEKISIEELNKALPDELKSTDKLIGKSPFIKETRELINQIAPSKSNTLITGETGTGKDLIARLIHDESPRSNAEYVAINCAAISPTLLESELFGYVKGAFTGADIDKPGLIEKANKGTLFLDEIGDMPSDQQTKLLRLLETKELYRVGSTAVMKVDFRLICATNQDLRKLIKQGTFRNDLFNRINVIEIPIPPLRNRKEDVALLVPYFITNISEKIPKTIRSISTTTLEFLKNADWEEGNTRTLRNVIERAIVLSTDDDISMEDLPQNITPRPIQNCESEATYPTKAKNGLIKQAKGIVARQLVSECHGSKQKAASIFRVSDKTIYRYLKD